MEDLRLSGLTKRFGETVAVAGFDLAVRQGEFVALLGPSGCGKTTVLRMVAGIASPDQGRIEIGGSDVVPLPPERRQIGLVFQSYALFPHMTVAENVAFGLRMRGIGRSERDARVRRGLEMVALDALGTRWPRELSGGQQQRVALARALVTEPRVLLLDEPLSNLDAALREQLRGELRTLQRNLGVTTLHVTHDQTEALAMADRVVVMDQGRVVEIGAPAALYTIPRQRFTAEFLGAVNLVHAVVTHGIAQLPWGDRVPAGDGHDGPALFCIRPEDVVLHPDPDGPATVVDATFHGRDVEVRLAVSGAVLRARRGGREAPLPPGSRLRLDFPVPLHRLEITTR
jgi:putative spermidine/putrescine transport system ATP-binding protein